MPCEERSATNALGGAEPVDERQRGSAPQRASGFGGEAPHPRLLRGKRKVSEESEASRAVDRVSGPEFALAPQGRSPPWRAEGVGYNNSKLAVQAG